MEVKDNLRVDIFRASLNRSEPANVCFVCVSDIYDDRVTLAEPAGTIHNTQREMGSEERFGSEENCLPP
jgi:predicted double-glycine peptidase